MRPKRIAITDVSVVNVESGSAAPIVTGNSRIVAIALAAKRALIAVDGNLGVAGIYQGPDKTYRLVSPVVFAAQASSALSASISSCGRYIAVLRGHKSQMVKEISIFDASSGKRIGSTSGTSVAWAREHSHLYCQRGRQLFRWEEPFLGSPAFIGTLPEYASLMAVTGDFAVCVRRAGISLKYMVPENCTVQLLRMPHLDVVAAKSLPAFGISSVIPVNPQFWQKRKPYFRKAL